MAFSISEVSISNQALLELGASTINALDEQQKEAVLCNASFANTRRELLRTHPWNFALKQVQLAQDITVPIFDWKYSYTLPSDFLRLWKVSEGRLFKVQGKKILSNYSTCTIEYIFDAEDVATWDASFVTVMVAALRYKLAYAITQSASEEQRSYDLYLRKLIEAKGIDGSEDTQNDTSYFEDTLINARFSR